MLDRFFPQPPRMPRSPFSGGEGGPDRGDGRRKPPALRGRRLALLGVAGESVGVLAGAAGWKLSGEPIWLVMAGISLALALVLLRKI
jgi:hypothetical protein